MSEETQNDLPESAVESTGNAENAEPLSKEENAKKKRKKPTKKQVLHEVLSWFLNPPTLCDGRRKRYFNCT